jgi:hypothetical protein
VDVDVVVDADVVAVVCLHAPEETVLPTKGSMFGFQRLDNALKAMAVFDEADLAPARALPERIVSNAYRSH